MWHSWRATHPLNFEGRCLGCGRNTIVLSDRTATVSGPMFTRAMIGRCVSKGLPIFTITADRTVVHIERNAKLVGQYQQRLIVDEGRITDPLRHVRRWVCERLWSL
jgi:hypothetical protein